MAAKLNVIVPFVGLKELLLPLTSERPYPLLSVCGLPLLGHILSKLYNAGQVRVIILIDDGAEQVADWTRTHYPDQDINIVRVQSTDLLEALVNDGAQWLTGPDPILINLGSAIVETDYAEINEATGDVVCYVRHTDDAERADLGYVPLPGRKRAPFAGACWFRDAGELYKLLAKAAAASFQLASIFEEAKSQGLLIEATKPFATMISLSPQGLLATSARLMQIGHGSHEAIERGYAEDFTVIPPVFLHETASLQNVVIGPYVSVEEGATIRDSVVSRSVVGPHAQIDSALLDRSLIGAHGQIQGEKTNIIAGDHSHLNLLNKHDPI